MGLAAGCEMNGRGNGDGERESAVGDESSGRAA